MAVQETADAGFVIIGCTRSFGSGGSDYLLIKTDSAGNELWATALGGPGDEFGLSVIETADGGFVFSGKASSVRGADYDLSLVKTDPQGVLLWARSYGGIRDEAGYSVLERSDGGFMVAGYTASSGHGMEDVYLIRTDEVGDLVWDRAYGGEGNDRGQALIQTTDGQYVIAGKTWSYGAGGFDVLLLKADQDGTLVWLDVYGANGYDCGYAIAETSDGGFLVAGETDSFGQGDFDVYAVRTDRDGTAIWQKTFGGGGDDSGLSVLQAADGGFLIGGDTTSYGAGGYDGYLIKTDQDGAVRYMP
jgi:regulation of enolase protein 1 (concanavalin A-like superfamily)